MQHVQSTNSETTEWIYIQIHQPELKYEIIEILQLFLENLQEFKLFL